MIQLLMNNSARGEDNLAILETLRDQRVRPIAININLQTDSEFERGGSQTDIRQEGGDAVFAFHIRNYIEQSQSASSASSRAGTSSLCLVGNDHVQGIKKLTEDFTRSEVITISSYESDAVDEGVAQCLAK